MFKKLFYVLCIIGCCYAAFHLFQSANTGKSNEINDDNFEDIVLNSSKPVLLYFYSTQGSRAYKDIMPTFKKFSSLLEDDYLFAHCCMQANSIDEDYEIKYDGTCVFFEDGEVTEEESLKNLNKDPAVGRGQLYAMFEDELESQILAEAPSQEIKWINIDDFETQVMESDKLVLVHFTNSNTSCSIINSIRTYFNDASLRYGGVADFYCVDTAESGNVDLLVKYKLNKPLPVMMFYKGKEVHRCYPNMTEYWYDKQILGMILPYII